MAKSKSSFVCQNCGAVTQRWQGKCESCGEWNTIVEEAVSAGIGAAIARNSLAGRAFALEDLTGAARAEARIVTGIAELDRVAGGGFVPGSVALIGGEPGIGKSTLLIQACAALAKKGGRVVYISGEESTSQVRLRAERLGLSASPVQLAAQTGVEDIVATLTSGDKPKLVVIDSIQTMWSGAIDSAPGTVSQVRGSAQALIRFAKASGAAVFAGIEGARPLLVEIQALVAPSTLGTPRRAVVGWDSSRLAMILAVLEAHGGLKLGQYDIYLNVAGGLKITEPAADLAAAAALISSLVGVSLPHDSVYFGEIGLSGAVRSVAHASLRLKEAAKLGFTGAVAPPLAQKEKGDAGKLSMSPISSVGGLVAQIAAASVEHANGTVRVTK